MLSECWLLISHWLSVPTTTPKQCISLVAILNTAPCITNVMHFVALLACNSTQAPRSSLVNLVWLYSDYMKTIIVLFLKLEKNHWNSGIFSGTLCWTNFYKLDKHSSSTGTFIYTLNFGFIQINTHTHAHNTQIYVLHARTYRVYKDWIYALTLVIIIYNLIFSFFSLFSPQVCTNSTNFHENLIFQFKESWKVWWIFHCININRKSINCKNFSNWC